MIVFWISRVMRLLNFNLFFFLHFSVATRKSKIADVAHIIYMQNIGILHSDRLKLYVRLIQPANESNLSHPIQEPVCPTVYLEIGKFWKQEKKEQRPSILKQSVREGGLDVDESLLDLCQTAVVCFKTIIGITEVQSTKQFRVSSIHADRTSYIHSNQTLSYAKLKKFIKVKFLYIKHLRYSVSLESLKGENHLGHQNRLSLNFSSNSLCDFLWAGLHLVPWRTYWEHEWGLKAQNLSERPTFKEQHHG